MTGYLRNILREVVAAVIPIVVTVTVLNFTIAPTTRERFLEFLVGAAFLFVGFVLFLVGVKLGLVPLGEFIGASLPQRANIYLLLGVGLAIGFVVTAAEPDVRVLAHMVANVDDSISSARLIYTVALGVGLFVVVSLVRVLKEIPLVWLLVPLYALVFILALWVPPEFIAVAFDAGGVTTGPVTVPFILALNVGVVSVLASRDRMGGSFGLVALASIGPILAVFLLSILN